MRPTVTPATTAAPSLPRLTGLPMIGTPDLVRLDTEPEPGNMTEALGLVVRLRGEVAQLQRELVAAATLSERRRMLLEEGFTREHIYRLCLVMIADFEPVEGEGPADAQRIRNSRTLSSYTLERTPRSRVTVDDLCDPSWVD